MDQQVINELAVKVSEYFRDFLDSDFKRAQAPKRRIRMQSDTGFRTAIRLSDYPRLNSALWSLIDRPCGDEHELDVVPGKYTRPISPILKQLIDAQIAAIKDETIDLVKREIHGAALSSRASAIDDPEKWVEDMQTVLLREVGVQIVSPFIAQLEASLERSSKSAIDKLFSAQHEMLAQVAQSTHDKLPQGLSNLLATGDDQVLMEVLESFLTLADIQSSLRAFFSGFSTSDAFSEFNDLTTYASTGDSFQLYLYLGALGFRTFQYPLFFLPLEVERSKNGQSFKIRIINHLFVNRRAIDFALQETSVDTHRGWVSPLQDRITYLRPNQCIRDSAGEMFDRVTSAFGVAGQLMLGEFGGSASTTEVQVSSAAFFAVFERADESLINDFEEIIDLAKRGSSAVVNLFTDLVKGVITENPVSIREAVDDTWDALPLVDRVVFDSPIPLNEEQRKILVALRSSSGRIIVVEGPPGTGKSHTITAIAADCAFNNKSCLILSDKREALDVVQAKLSDAMNRVRHDENFPNPLLRLGQQNANFKRLTSNQTIAKVTTYARAIKAHMPEVERETKSTSDSLKKSISDTVRILGEITVEQIHNLHTVESDLNQIAPSITELLKNECSPNDLSELEVLLGYFDGIEEYLRTLFARGEYDETALRLRATKDSAVAEFASGHDCADWAIFHSITATDMELLKTTLLAFQQERMPIFGYLFRGRKVNELDRLVNGLHVSRAVSLKADSHLLAEVLSGAQKLHVMLERSGVEQEFSEAFAALAQSTPIVPESAPTLKVVEMFGRIDAALVNQLLACKTPRRAELWRMALNFLCLWNKIESAFRSAPEYDYVSAKSGLERLNTSVMNAHVDTRLVKFMDEKRSDAKALAAVISNRQKFPEKKFSGVKDAFPVIISSIREFGEYMPLLPNLFDVVVIDEASQVSVAQALPALLRASKVVVLGDSKQFSNVKSTNASIALNEKYRSGLVSFFERRVSREAATLERLAAFDVKKSILEFCSLCASYSVMLRKHFRSYPELIGYSSETFYGNQLQAIKVREKPIEEVIRFSEIDATDSRTTRGTNEVEAFFILDRILELLELEDPPTVGIITPFREQQKFLTQMLFRHAKARMFEDRLRLKIMTFDSCQGEERNIIFYSMVATIEEDALNYIFPLDLGDAQESVEAKLRVQRLNVGFSRAQETIWFVHSKPIEAFRGAIAQAMQYYKATLAKAGEAIETQTDPASPMERKVLGWIHETEFYRKLSHAIEIRPQFPIGEYLKQLDPLYTHPAWRVDFLFTLRTDAGHVKLVIEYDGFEYHFDKGGEIHSGNYERYLKEADVERQLVLESYGYRFLRINRFNLGRDPVATLSDRLAARVKASLDIDQKVSMTDVLASQAQGLEKKELKACSRCGQIKPHSEYFDRALGGGNGGFGRICISCKAAEMRRRPMRSW